MSAMLGSSLQGETSTVFGAWPARGLSISAYVRQAVLLALKADEAEGGGK